MKQIKLFFDTATGIKGSVGNVPGRKYWSLKKKIF